MAATIKAFTAGATKEGLTLCAADFEAETGIRVEAHTTHGHLIEERVIAKYREVLAGTGDEPAGEIRRLDAGDEPELGRPGEPGGLADRGEETWP